MCEVKLDRSSIVPVIASESPWSNLQSFAAVLIEKPDEIVEVKVPVKPPNDT